MKKVKTALTVAIITIVIAFMFGCQEDQLKPVEPTNTAKIETIKPVQPITAARIEQPKPEPAKRYQLSFSRRGSFLQPDTKTLLYSGYFLFFP